MCNLYRTLPSTAEIARHFRPGDRAGNLLQGRLCKSLKYNGTNLDIFLNNSL